MQEVGGAVGCRESSNNLHRALWVYRRATRRGWSFAPALPQPCGGRLWKTLRLTLRMWKRRHACGALIEKDILFLLSLLVLVPQCLSYVFCPTFSYNYFTLCNSMHAVPRRRTEESPLRKWLLHDILIAMQSAETRTLIIAPTKER